MGDGVQPQSLTDPLREQLLSECLVMLRFALSSGLELPKPVLDILDAMDRQPDQRQELPALAAIYGQLLQITAPATPRGLRMMQDDERDHKTLHKVGPVPSIRYLMAVAIVFSLLFFGISLMPEINRTTLAPDIYDMYGIKLFWVLTFLLSASGLGATFGALFEAYQYVAEGRYDTKYDSLYWTRIGLGLVSGLMLAELLPQKGGELLERPLLALLGGFSASVVHRVLQRLVEVIEGVFAPPRAADQAADERAIRARVSELQGSQRGALARSFDSLLDDVASGVSIAEARKTLVHLLSENATPLAGGRGVGASRQAARARSPQATAGEAAGNGRDPP
jgi:hypothetical protein